MTPDDLDSKTERELDEIFAVEVASLKIKQAPKKDCGYWVWLEALQQWCAGPSFCTDANIVLPWLEKECSLQRFGVSEVYPEKRHSDGSSTPKLWHVTIIVRGEGFWRHDVIGSAPTFPLAATKALIRAHRAQKT